MNHYQITAFTNKLKKDKDMLHKTNRQILTKAIKELSDIDLVFLRERMLKSCDEILNNKEQLIKDMQFGIVSPHLIIECMENIKEKIDF
jgi:5-carboxymethyl-2-hydroxymuconate isomerase